MRFRGSILDVLFVGILAITLIITGYVLYDVTDRVATVCEDTQVAIGAPTYASDACTQARVAARNFVDLIPAIIFFAVVGVFIYAAYVPVNPIFLALGIFSLVITVVFFYNFQEAFKPVLQAAYFAPLIALFPLPAQIANNIVLIIGSAGFLVLIVLYSRLNAGGRPEG